ncbi:MAG: hypothetical protein NVS4B8_30620 [Herpetosiphon sp.]
MPVDIHPAIWIIILNWRHAEATCRCLARLRTSVSPASVIVLDNASGDGSVARIAGAFPEVVLLPLEQNLGFAAAVNIGIRYAVEQGADAICLLNNDAVLANDALGQLWGALNASPDNGIVSAKVFLHREPPRFWAVGGRFTNRRVINLGAGEFDNGQYDGMALDFVYLCAALIRVELLSIIGDLDEQFFLYYEDIDLSLRARAAGYRVLVAPDAHAWHDGSLSTRDRPISSCFTKHVADYGSSTSILTRANVCSSMLPSCALLLCAASAGCGPGRSWRR